MKVTRFNYPLEKNLLKKIDLMCDRCTDKRNKKDALLLCEGGEGEGKSTYSIALAYYISEKTNRPFNAKHVFFDVEKMIEFAQNTKEQILIWDEPALQALSTDWASKAVKNITRLLMMARKKRHFIIINMTKFYKFNEYIVVDRALGMIHVYSRRNIESGRFRYIRKSNLEPLWRDYRYAKKRNYAKYSAPHIKGTFPDILSPSYPNNVLKEFDIALYEKNKDEAIKSIGGEGHINTPQKVEMETKYNLYKNLIKCNPELKQKEISQLLEVSVRTIQAYASKMRNEPEFSAKIYNNGNQNTVVTPLPTVV